ncbi:MAG: nicotinate-nucleotide--dimethylbenzimidazole phosphoribosyltransferase [Treponema sp.]|jgi:nicotinate-nucleotide--dimethylbenzimidazole phosphoribosyltransferase|nr:nicotinate-nucleotide--dimethylbenzimidazole phosphoribosyltransferase [Treponema sp.]
MTINILKEYLSQIKSLDTDAMARAKARLDSLAKPPGSLGKLEDIAVRLAGISGDVFYDTGKRCVIIMASDNGVVEEGVASAPQEVTHAQTLNFIKGLTGVSVLAKQFNADLIVVDVGINANIDNPLIRNRKIRKSTWNIAKGEAMTYNEAIQAIVTGIETAIEASKDGYKLLGAGEMGIGNTSSAAAVLCALTGIAVEQATGKGAGLKEEAYKHKVEVIKKALEINKPNIYDPIDTLAVVGGFDIAAMVGVYIGAAVSKTPVVIDGFISMVAALAASQLNPIVKEYMFASHASYEQGFMHAAAALEIEPCLNLNMRLGEGSGCPLMFAVIDAASAIIKNMGTFEQANIGDEYLNEIKEGDNFSLIQK